LNPTHRHQQFFEEGCDNCAFFQMIDDRDRVAECTTPSYSGIVSTIDPAGSWTAKWLRLGKMVPGCYALEINDDVPEGIQQEIEDRMEGGR
jgi:transcription elongation factor SPT4|tara:strand:+ start:71 stop:343 length:273 start_codon:yes stop_codon:yes gene_type:complete